MFIFFCLLMQAIVSNKQAADQSPATMQEINPRIRVAMKIDDERAAANGIRKLTGAHLILYTDVRERADIDELVTVFDLAVPQWNEFFSIRSQRSTPWQMQAFVMEDKSRFAAAGLIPDDLPEFPAGYQRGHEMWLYLQPGDYYTRHLLLHEGTHAFMSWFVGGVGAPWYSEGMAEWMGLNHWEPGSSERPPRLEINYHIEDRNETPYWGRVKVIRDGWSTGTALSLEDSLNIPGSAFRDVRYYGWAWATCEFLSQHPLARSAFTDFAGFADRPEANFKRHVNRSLQPHRDILARDWRLFISEIDYGIDASKTCLIQAHATSPEKGLMNAAVAANHGWQSTTFEVKSGDRLRVSSPSRFVVGKSEVLTASDGLVEKPWSCEANGITLEYYRGQPLGILLAGIYQPDSTDVDTAIEGLLTPLAVGQDSVLTIPRDGVLCLRINDSPARMDDNVGVLEVRIEKLE